MNIKYAMSVCETIFLSYKVKWFQQNLIYVNFNLICDNKLIILLCLRNKIFQRSCCSIYFKNSVTRKLYE